MVVVMRRPTRPRREGHGTTDCRSQAQAKPHRGSPDDSFATAKHYICTMLGVVMAVHFWSAYVQNTALIGADGLVPCAAYVKDRIKTGSFWTWPCVWWWIEPSDANLDAVALTGLANALLLAVGAHYSHLVAICWLCHSSIVNAAEASSFYSLWLGDAIAGNGVSHDVSLQSHR